MCIRDSKDILNIVEQLRAAEKRFNELTAEADADVQSNEDKVYNYKSCNYSLAGTDPSLARGGRGRFS